LEQDGQVFHGDARQLATLLPVHYRGQVALVVTSPPYGPTTHGRVSATPGGHIVITLRPWREHAELIDLPAQILACGIHAGLVPVERCVALLARVAENDLVARGSFFQRDFIRKQRHAGLPLHLIAHEDVLVFRTKSTCWGSGKLKHIQREPKCSSASLWGSDAGVRQEPGGVAA